jgi:hypothetical protein
MPHDGAAQPLMVTGGVDDLGRGSLAAIGNGRSGVLLAGRA